ncbi:MAG: D-alanyl-D-alanine carboxypeptidase [Actinobacteria bacterium]|nr:D-alanyl-D-alanine carboxypeptidase [Actinomycetota bacterium]
MNNDDGPGAAQVDPTIADADAPAVDAPHAAVDEDAPEPGVLFPTPPNAPGSASLFGPRADSIPDPLFPAPDSPASAPLFGSTADQAPPASTAAEQDPAIEAARRTEAAGTAAPAAAADPAPEADWLTTAEPILAAESAVAAAPSQLAAAASPVTTPLPDATPAAVATAATPTADAPAEPDPAPFGQTVPAASAPSAESAVPAAPAAPATPAAAQPLPSASVVRGPDRAPAGALTWVDAAHLGDAADASAPAASGALLDDAPRRSLARPGVLLPIAGVLVVAVAYGVTTALWPLNAVKPVASAVAFQPAAAPAAALPWPAAGSAAVGVAGIGTVASAEQPAPMASITKLVTVLASLDKLPLKPGEQGPSFDFTQADSDEYWSYLRQDQSALDVPVGGSLTQYQLLEGILLGSANNYADRLAREVWGSDADYAAAANQWLSQHDLGEIHVVTPSGFDFGNVATPRALIQLGEIAEKNPVIAGIVKQKSVDLPGAGTVHNTNGLIDDAGIIGIKTGTIGDGDNTRYNLLSAKDLPDGDATVRIYVAALGQTSDEGRVDASRALYAGVEAALKDQPQTVTEGAALGNVDTAWGETAQIVAAADARVILWNGAAATTTTKFSLGDGWKAGEKAGTLTIKGPLDSATVPLKLRTALNGPTLWWRLTHPLELFGLTK